MTSIINFADYVDSESFTSQKEGSNSNRPSNSYNSSSKKLRIQRSNIDEFKPGAIVKLKVTNFVTYALTEFHLSPSLNMIIGPNGSGKSTFVCAICLGLAGKPEYIGRSKKVEEYIKNGTDQGTIEITLKNSELLSPSSFPMINESDDVVHIKRVMVRGRKKSEYFVNNVTVDETVVRSLVQSLNIQLDNLCQFLSQERVEEFAKLKPHTLLNETIRSVEAGLLEKLNQLKSLQFEGDDLKRELESNEAKLGELIGQRDSLEGQVHALELYEEKTRQLELHEKLLNYAYVKEHKERNKDLKAKCTTLTKEIKKMEKEKKPYVDLGSKLREDEDRCKITLEELDRERYSTKASFNRTREKLNAIAKKLQDGNQRVSYLKTRNKNLKEEIKDCQEKIKTLEASKADIQLPDPSLIESVDRKIEELREGRAILNDTLTDVDNKITTIKYSIESAKKEYALTQRLLSGNDKLHLLDEFGQNNNTIFLEMKDAIQYVRSLPDARGKIFEPPILSIAAKSQTYAAYLASCVDFHTSMSLTMLDKETYDQFSEDIVSKFKVNIREVSNQTTEPPMSREELRKYGFEGYLVDFIDGEENVIRMLCQQQKIHMIPVTRQDLSASHLERLKRPDNNGNIPFPRFIAGKYIHTIKKSEYGSRQSFSSSTAIDMKNRFYLGSAMSATESSRLRSTIDNLTNRIKDLEKELHKFKDKRASKENELADLNHTMNNFNTQKSELTKGAKKLNQIDVKIGQFKEKMQGNTEKLRVDTTETMKMLEESLKKMYEEERALILDLPRYTARLQQLDVEMLTKSMEKLDITIKLNSLSHVCLKLEEALQLKREERADAIEEYKNGKDTSDYKKWTDTIKSFSESEKNILNEIATNYHEQSQFNSEYIESIIDRLTSELSLINNDASVIEILNKTVESIKSLEKTIPIQRTKIGANAQLIEDIRRELEPSLDTIIQQISKKFASLFVYVGSAGEVKLVKPEQFSDWRIEIRVKFRDNSELQQLNPHIQSGGERAVSTVLYMIALQQFTSAPFRVVDEINQGMDQSNERIVHKIMVENACAANTSQYFLITPKLLTNLYYHERMRIHCVFAGSWIPDPIANPERVHFGETSSYIL